MFSLHVKKRKQLQTETGSVPGPVLFTSWSIVQIILKRWWRGLFCRKS